jgi:NAD(P)-dependent dehydrogenase (short-subunit alcohol dehydrogenase family)
MPAKRDFEACMQEYQPSADLLRDRVILVTGAGDGIGKAVSLALADHGATVVLLGRTLKKLERVYDAIEEAGNPQPAIYPMNLEGASPKDYEELANVVGGEFGRLDGLLHNAAELGDLRPIQHYDIMVWTQVLQANLTAPFLLTQACLGLLREAPAASLVFTHDSVADEPRAYWGAYGVAKGGLRTLAGILAQELESNTSIRVNLIDPGPVATGLRLQAYPAEDRSRLRSPEEVVSPYLFLMGDDSRHLHGEVIRVAEPLPVRG